MGERTLLESIRRTQPITTAILKEVKHSSMYSIQSG